MAKPRFGRVYLRGRTWWIEFWHHGQQFRESSKSDRKKDAEDKLRSRLAEIAGGIFAGIRADQLLVSDLLDGLIDDYRVNRKKSIAWVEHKAGKGKDGKGTALRSFFGGMKAVRVNPATIKLYIRERQEAGRANATINRELALLHRSFVLAKEAGKLPTTPKIKLLEEHNIREGFFEYSEFLAMRHALPEELRPVITFAYWTGCRKTELLTLRWSQVDLQAGFVRLDAADTKNREPRLIPLNRDLREMLSLLLEKRNREYPACPWVFTRDGADRIRNLRAAWDKACTASGVQRLFHDLRRTGVRNLVRAGVSERVAMAISGHKTRSVFDRYQIVSERDLKRAADLLDAMATAEQTSNSRTKPARPVKNRTASGSSKHAVN